MAIFGTRPEAIKLVPVIRRLRKLGCHVVICVTAQQREMLDQSLAFFEIIPDYDLDIMTDHQDLFYVTTEALVRLKKVLRHEKQDVVLVQGDTTTAFTASLAFSETKKLPDSEDHPLRKLFPDFVEQLQGMQ